MVRAYRIGANVCAQAKFDDAAKEMKLSMAAAPADQKTYLDGLEKRLEAKQDINQ